MYPVQYFGNRFGQIDEFKSLIIKAREKRSKPYKCCYDLFAGSASLTLSFLEHEDFAEEFVINDIFAPIVLFWKQLQINPRVVVDTYDQLLKGYLDCNSIESRQGFFQTTQEKLNLNSIDINYGTPEQAAIVAFVINHAQHGIPIITGKGSGQKLNCQLIETVVGKLPIDEQFADVVWKFHNILKNIKIHFFSKPFSEILDKITSDDFVMLDPPYPDMPDAEQSPDNHIYQRTEPKSELQIQLNKTLKSLKNKGTDFFMFYGVLGMENLYPIKWRKGHVLHLAGNENGPFKRYVEHLYLSPNLAKLQCDVSMQINNQSEIDVIQPCFHQLFEAQAYEGQFKNGNRIAIVWRDKQWTYAEINKAANRLVHYLREHGLTEKMQANKAQNKDTLVALYLERGPQLIISMLAVMKTGAAYLSLENNTYRLSEEAAKRRIEQSQADLLLTNHDFSTIENTFEGTINNLAIFSQAIPIDNDDYLLEKLTKDYVGSLEKEANLKIPISPQALAYVIYTSGSTGEPKGVEILHRGLPYAFESHQDLLNLGPDDKVAQFASIGFDASLMEIMMALGSGAELHIVDDETYSDTFKLNQFLIENKISVVIQTPKMLELLDPDNFPNLKALLIIGDKIPKVLSEAWIKEVTVNGAKQLRKVVKGYGLAETTMCISLELCSTTKPYTVPKTILGCNVLSELPNTHDMSLYGPCIARGYWLNPNLTISRFRTLTLNSQTKTVYQHTNINFLSQATGKFMLTGNIKREVKIRGHYVELGEVEAKILESIDQVADARVVVHNKKINFNFLNEAQNWQNKILAVYLVPKNKNLIIYDLQNPSIISVNTLHQLQIELLKELPEYMCPALTNMLWVAKLPRKDDNQYDDNMMRELWPCPCIKLPYNNDLLENLKFSDLEDLNRIHSLFAQALDIDQALLGYEDNFYDLGGNSFSVQLFIESIKQSSYNNPKLARAVEELTVNEFNKISNILMLWQYLNYKLEYQKTYKNFSL